MNVLAAIGDEPRPVRMEFSGKEADLFRILLRGSLLQIPSFGFYRFWLLTDVRRHLWANTRIGEDSFEYTGRARELLIGFLIAMAILVPVYLAYFLVAFEVERMQAFASIPMFLVLYVFGYYALYRARRYRAAHTVFRGVRFWMDGSGWAYLGRAVVFDLLTLITLGFAYSWRAAALERYKMNHTHYGSMAGSFVASGWTLFKRGAWIWALYLFGALATALLAFTEHWVLAVLVGIAVVVATLFLWPLFRAIELRWWLEGVRFGPVEAASDLPVRAVLWCYVRTVLISIAYGGVAGTAAGLLAVIATGVTTLIAGSATALPVAAAIPGIVLGGAAYIAFLLGFDIIRRLVLDRGLWEAAVQSVTLVNLESLDAARGTGAEMPGGVGEGLLDALDMGGGW